jgi:hypothetical protein
MSDIPVILVTARSSTTLAHFWHFKLQTFEPQVIRDRIVPAKIRFRIYRLEN